jgi:archaetidylserine synthase
MSLRVLDRLGAADAMTLLNTAIGTAAMAAAALGEVRLVAQLLLLAAVADALDGIIARRYGGTRVGPYLDSMADIVSFGTAPALFVFVAAREEWRSEPLTLADEPVLLVVAAAVAAVFVVFSLVRTALYTVYVDEDENRPGIQNTLAASLLAAAYLAGLSTLAVGVELLLGAAVVLSIAMVAPAAYPKLLARDALVMGFVQMGAVLIPTAAGRAFPRVLLVGALAYMLLGPVYYWGE